MKYLGMTALLLCVIGAGCFSQEQEPVLEKPTENEESQEELQIILDTPEEGGEVTSPLVLRGEARVFEGTVNWRLKKMNGAIVDEGYFMTKDIDNELWGEIDERIFLPVLEDEQYILEVFEVSMADGSDRNLVMRHIRVKDEGKTSVRVYFVDPAMAETGDCTLVDFEKRTLAHTENVAELAIKELLAGPTSSWAQTEVPPYATLDSVNIVDGGATVNFIGSESGWNGGSCHVMALRAQIEETLKQFDSVDSVVIQVNGSSDKILEP